MDMGKTISLGRCTQSIEICILLVNDDLICRNIVMDMLQNCNHEAYDCERAMDALNVIKGRIEKLELVITNVERTDANRLGIIEHIEKEFKLRVALMRPDGSMKILSRGTENGATVYIVKCSSLTDIKNLWENALARERGKMVANEAVNHQRESFLEISSDSGVSERNKVLRKRKRYESGETSEQNEDTKDDSKLEKKARIQWNDEMHRKFLEAIAQLGHERAFPKKIVEVMNIPGLTREHVASHLQKHRMNLKKNQENLIGSFYGRTSINDLKEACFPSSRSAPLTFGFQQRSSSTHPLLVPAFSHSHFNPELSISKPRIGSGQSFSVNNQGKLHFSYNKHNFRVYGDQTKNILLSVENTNAKSGFVGLRLADDGKSVEIGQTGSLGISGINTELRSSPSGIHGIKNYFQYSSTFDTGPNENIEQYPLSALHPLETNGNENVNQLLALPVSFSPDQQSLPPLGEYNGNENLDIYPFSSLQPLISDVEKSPEQSLPPLGGYENLDLYPFSSLPQLMSDVKENLEQSLPPLGGYNGNENLENYPFSSLPPLITDVEENLDHCPLLPVDFTPLQQCSLNGVENCGDYLLQQYSPTQFMTFGEVNSDNDHMTFVDSTTSLNPPFEQEPSVSLLSEEGFTPPLQLVELDCFRVSEDIDVLVGSNTRSLSVDDFANILFDQEINH